MYKSKLYIEASICIYMAKQLDQRKGGTVSLDLRRCYVHNVS